VKRAGFAGISGQQKTSPDWGGFSIRVLKWELPVHRLRDHNNNNNQAMRKFSESGVIRE
jgi:hypothetical protein